MQIILTTGTEMYQKEGFQPFFIENLHPTKQLDQILDLLEECISNNGKYLFFLNNEITVQNFNNLILLHQKEELSKRLGFRGLAINPSDIQMFEYVDNEHVQLELGEYGFRVKWIEAYLHDFFDKTLELQVIIEEENALAEETAVV